MRHPIDVAPLAMRPSHLAPPDAAFAEIEDRGYRASELTRGPWLPEQQHAGPPIALVCRAIEQAAAAHGLTEGQVAYALRKFREQGMEAFSAVSRAGTAESADPEAEVESLRAMVDQLNSRVAELQQQVDTKPAGEAMYTPTYLLAMVRENVSKLDRKSVV